MTTPLAQLYTDFLKVTRGGCKTTSPEYRANTPDMKFILHEMLKIEDTLLKREAFADFGLDDINRFALRRFSK